MKDLQHNRDLAEKFYQFTDKFRLRAESIGDHDAEIADYWLQVLQEDRKQTEKAFGGCTDCYGKGYSTEKVQAGNSRYGIWELDPIHPCSCDRGKQISEMRANDRKATIDMIKGKKVKPNMEYDTSDPVEMRNRGIEYGRNSVIDDIITSLSEHNNE